MGANLAKEAGLWDVYSNKKAPNFFRALNIIFIID